MQDFQQRLKATIVAETSNADAIMALVARELTVTAKVGLVTITSVDPHDQSYERLFSSMPKVYPVSGRKPANRSKWSETVMEKKQSFVANDRESLAEVMSDHELISSLGFSSILNVPIVQYGKVIGTLNCLSTANHFTKTIIAECEKMTLPVVVALTSIGRVS